MRSLSVVSVMSALAISLFSTACSDSASPFVGVWHNLSGSSTQSCPGHSPQATAIPIGSLALTVTKTGSSSISLSADLGGGSACTLSAQVTDTTAAITVGQTCAIDGGTLTLASGTAATTDGVTLAVNFGGTADIAGATCNQTFTLTLKK